MASHFAAAGTQAARLTRPTVDADDEAAGDTNGSSRRVAILIRRSFETAVLHAARAIGGAIVERRIRQAPGRLAGGLGVRVKLELWVDQTAGTTIGEVPPVSPDSGSAVAA